VSVAISESADRITVRANILGFAENEVKVSVEPHRVVILGKKQVNATETEGGKLEYIDWNPDQILRVVDLPKPVRPEGAVIQLRAGLLQIDLPKVPKKAAQARARVA